MLTLPNQPAVKISIKALALTVEIIYIDNIKKLTLSQKQTVTDGGCALI